MVRNLCFLIIGALIVVGAGYAYSAYKQGQKQAGIAMKVGRDRISVEQN